MTAKLHCFLLSAATAAAFCVMPFLTRAAKTEMTFIINLLVEFIEEFQSVVAMPQKP